MKKKGLSNIIATVLIILLVLGAAVLIRIAIKNLSVSSSKNVRNKFNLMGVNFDIIDSTVNVSSDQNISFIVERMPGSEDVSAFPIIVLKDSWGYSKAIYSYNTSNLKEFEKLLININRTGNGGHQLSNNLARVLVYAALIDDEGKIVTAQAPSDVYEIGIILMGGGTVKLTLDVTPTEAAGQVLNESGSAYGAITEFLNGADVYLNATQANEQYIFFNWIENGTQLSTENPLRFSITSDRAITANFSSSGIEFLNGCGVVLDKKGMRYELIQNLTTTGTCFNITADDVILNGNGNIITGNNASGFFGIVASSVNNATISGLTIVHFDTGIGFFNTKSSELSYNVIALGEGNSVVLRGSSEYNQIIKNIIGYNSINGILVQSGSYNNLTSNLVGLNIENGIQISSPAETSNSQDNNLSNNYFLNNTLAGIFLWSKNSNANYFFNNTVYGNKKDGINLTYSNYSIFFSNYICYNGLNEQLDIYCDNSSENYGSGKNTFSYISPPFPNRACWWVMPTDTGCWLKLMPNFPSPEVILQGNAHIDKVGKRGAV